MFVMHGVPSALPEVGADATTCDAVVDPEAADRRIGMGEGQTIGCQRDEKSMSD
jgi:hypothetical protein